MQDEDAKPVKVKRPQQVYTLLVQVGRKAGDGLPPDATAADLAWEKLIVSQLYNAAQ